MAIPTTAKKAEAPMDPSDKVDYMIDMTDLLEAGEAFTDMEISVMAESALLGFQIETAAPYQPVEIGNGKVIVWASVAAPQQNSAGWSAGILCGVEVSAITDSSPPRHYQRTATIQVIQQ